MNRRFHHLFHRRSGIPVAAALLVPWLTLGAYGQAFEGSRPNIVCILAEDIGLGDEDIASLSRYNSERRHFFESRAHDRCHPHPGVN